MNLVIFRKIHYFSYIVSEGVDESRRYSLLNIAMTWIISRIDPG